MSNIPLIGKLAFHADSGVAALEAEYAKELAAAGEDQAKVDAILKNVKQGKCAQRLAVRLGNKSVLTPKLWESAGELLAKAGKLRTPDETKIARATDQAMVAFRAKNAVTSSHGNSGNANAVKSSRGNSGNKNADKVEGAPAPKQERIPASLVVPKAVTMQEIELYALVQAKAFREYVNKNAAAFRGAKGSAIRDAMLAFNTAIAEAVKIKD